MVLGCLDHRDDLEDAEALSLSSWGITFSTCAAIGDRDDNDVDDEWVDILGNVGAGFLTSHIYLFLFNKKLYLQEFVLDDELSIIV